MILDAALADRLAVDDAAVLVLGFAWIAARLDGGEGDAQWQAYAEARQTLVEAGTPAAIDRIGALFGLSGFETDLLLIALAAEVDAGVATRYALATGRAGASPASLDLVARLLFGAGGLPRDAWAALDPSGPLRRFALIAIEEIRGPAVAAEIRLPDRVRNLLMGIDAPDPALARLTRGLEPCALPLRLERQAGTIAERPGGALRVQITGPSRAGRRALAVEILAQQGLGALQLEATMLDLGELAVLARECMLGSHGVVLVEPDPALAAALDRTLPAALAVVAERPLAGLDAVPVVRLSRLDVDERLASWHQAAPDLASPDLARIAEHFALGPGEIAAIARQGGTDPWTAAREIGVRELELLATRISPERGWEDLVLAPECLAELRALSAQVGHRAEVHRDWGYRRVLGRATGISALFAGPSGVGKTMAAEAIARALSLELFTVDLSRVTSKYIGETEKNLSRIFDAAEAGGCVLFFDEADALFGKRSEVKDSHDRYANADVSYLLQRMEGFGGLAILATNLKSHLDTAFLRRIRMIVDFPMPDVAARIALWRRALPQAAPQAGIDLAMLARHELSGGNITTIAANAAFRAADDGSPITMAHLHAAMEAEFRKLDRDPSGLGGRR